VREGGIEDFVPEFVEEFNQTNRWGIRVEAIPYDSSGEMDEALRSAFDIKKIPLVLAGYSHDLRYWDAKGIPLADLQFYLDDPAWGLSSDDQQDFYPLFWVQDAQAPPGDDAGGMRFGLPWYRTGLVMFYNQGWAEELGFDDPPATPYQFRQQACAAARANREDEDMENNATGGWLIDSEPSTLLAWIYAFGGQVEKNGEQGYEFESPEAVDALTFIHQLYTEGCAWKSHETEKHEKFANRQALFISSSLRELVNQQAAMEKVSSEDAWTVLPFPSRKGGTLDVFGPSLAITKSTQAKQLAAWLFVRWLVSAENQARWVSATRTLPTRVSVLPLLRGEKSRASQWESALALLPFAQVEPSFASWRSLRWALSDVVSQLVSPEFKGRQISDLLKTLDQLAEEVQARGQ
jgi:ABC-type glycerol-3-phosphate transport system substrate-binding protein